MFKYRRDENQLRQWMQPEASTEGSSHSHTLCEPAACDSKGRCELGPRSRAAAMRAHSGAPGLFLGHTWGSGQTVSVSKDGKDHRSSRKYITWGTPEGNEDIYFQSNFESGEFKIVLNMKDNWVSCAWRWNVTDSVTFQRSRLGDLTRIHMEESGGQQGEAHAKDYDCHAWNVTPSVWVTSLSLDDPSKVTLKPMGQLQKGTRSSEGCTQNAAGYPGASEYTGMKMKTRVKKQLIFPKWQPICLCSVQLFSSSFRLLRECHEQKCKKHSITQYALTMSY